MREAAQRPASSPTTSLNGTSVDLFRAPIDHLHETLRDLLADGDAIGNADQIGVLELDARTLVAIVEQRVEAQRFRSRRRFRSRLRAARRRRN